MLKLFFSLVFVSLSLYSLRTETGRRNRIVKTFKDRQLKTSWPLTEPGAGVLSEIPRWAALLPRHADPRASFTGELMAVRLYSDIIINFVFLASCGTRRKLNGAKREPT